MQIYVGIVCRDDSDSSYNRDESNPNEVVKPPTGMSEDNAVRVRIPAFHGFPKNHQEPYSSIGMWTDDKSINYIPNSHLPWAFVMKSFGNESFNISELRNNMIVYVTLMNGNVNSPIILGYANTTYGLTYDKDNLNTSVFPAGGDVDVGILGSAGGLLGFLDFLGADDVVKLALAEWKDAKSNGNPNDSSGGYLGNDNKYKTEYFGKPGNEAQWCGIFCWYVFNKSGNGSYFCGGNKKHMPTEIMRYYKDKGQFITTDFKKGDLIFMNFDGGDIPTHIGICVQNTSSSSKSVRTVEGNGTIDTYANKGSEYTGNAVVKKDRELKYIIGGARVSEPISLNETGDSVIYRIFSFLVTELRLNQAVVCGILANMDAESSFNPKAVGDNGNSHGLCQWNDAVGNFAPVKAYCRANHLDYNSIEGQLKFLRDSLLGKNKDFLDSFMQNKYTLLYKSLKDITSNNVNSAKESAKLWCEFENPSDLYTQVSKRQTLAVTYWGTYGTLVAGSTNLKTGSGFEVSTKGFICPLQCPKVNIREYSWNHVKRGNHNRAMDIGNANGSSLGLPIYAVRAGTVTNVGHDSYSGNTVKLSHDGNYTSFYCHCQSIIVKKGDKVKQGQCIATVGNTGSASTGAHLHFDIRYNGVQVQEEDYLKSASGLFVTPLPKQ